MSKKTKDVEALEAQVAMLREDVVMLAKALLLVVKAEGHGSSMAISLIGNKYEKAEAELKGMSTTHGRIAEYIGTVLANGGAEEFLLAGSVDKFMSDGDAGETVSDG